MDSPRDAVTNHANGPTSEDVWLLNLTVDSRPEVSPSSMHSSLMALTLAEIREAIQSGSHSRENTRFFRIVKGGNVKFVRKVFQRLQRSNMHQELAWCLGDPASQNAALTEDSPCTRSFCHCLWFLTIFLWTVILTPVFYIVHTLVTGGLTSFRRRLTSVVDLPLAFAVLSQEPDMVSLFLEYGCQIIWCDSGGNNIYHYIGELSLEKEDVAKVCHGILCQLIKDKAVHKDVVSTLENDEGLTAMEYIAKYGSVTFFDFMVREKVAFGQPVFYVTKDEIWAKDSSGEYDCDGLLSKRDTGKNHSEISGSNKKSLNIMEVDISMYDRGDIYKRHSFLLHNIAGREVEVMSEANAGCILHSKLFSSWIKTKFVRYFVFCFFSHILNIGITGLLLWYLVRNGGDMNPLPLFSTYLSYLSENLEQAEHQLQFYLNSTNFTDILATLNSSRGQDYGLHTLTCLAKVNHTSRGTINCTLNALIRINNSCGGMPDEELWGMTLGSRNANYEVIWRDEVILALLIVISMILALNILLDLIIRLGFLSANYNFKAKSPLVGSLGFFQRLLPGSSLDKQLTVTMASLFFFYIFSHVLMMDTIRSRTTWIGKLIDFMNQDVYAQRHAVEIGKVGEIIRGLAALSVHITEMEITSNKIMNICILIRFFQVIHSLRLLPNIGFFIITTKKMAKHLLQFALVFVIVSLAFGTIFNFVMRDPECLAHKVHGFETLASSLFSSYQISLGSGSFNFLRNNMIAKISYIAYTITAMLLLLNLIIAVMTTTALELNKSPWRPAMCQVELWDEILGTEIAVRTLYYPFQALCRLKHAMHLGIERSAKVHKVRPAIELTYVSKPESC